MRSNNLWCRIYSISSISYFIHSKGNFEYCFFTSVCFVDLVSNLCVTISMKLCLKGGIRVSENKRWVEEFRHLIQLLFKAQGI